MSHFSHKDNTLNLKLFEKKRIIHSDLQKKCKMVKIQIK